VTLARGALREAPKRRKWKSVRQWADPRTTPFFAAFFFSLHIHTTPDSKARTPTPTHPPPTDLAGFLPPELPSARVQSIVQLAATPPTPPSPPGDQQGETLSITTSHNFVRDEIQFVHSALSLLVTSELGPAVVGPPNRPRQPCHVSS